MKLPYSEGTWFAVPLRTGGYATGLVARATSSGKIILAYFFGPPRKNVPALCHVAAFKPADAIKIAKVGDLALIRNEWPIIGRAEIWKRSEWPMISFVRRSELSGRAWKVCYSDTDPNLVIGEEETTFDTNLEADSVLGSGAAELVLTELLGEA